MPGASPGMTLVRRLGILLLFLLIPFLAAAAEPSYPALSGRIVDGAKLLDAEASARIAGKLKAHEEKTTDQVVVATVPSLQGLTIEDYANGLFRTWGLGDKAKNNGALLLVAPNERKVRIEVGYGLEGALTDALSKVIITTAVAPKFKNGDFSGGIEGGVDAILSILTGDAEEWQRRAQVREDESSWAEDLAVIFVMIMVFILIVSFMRELGRASGGARRHRMRDGRWVTLPPSSGSGWGGGSSSGGWSSGSSGGFSGGGGSSGGGGASGDW
ncbi:MAG: TPM domain-containing protein [Bosea sp.]|nr:TPM domain-containing protein [Bosea sp. (in: a-proteobacteria)]